MVGYQFNRTNFGPQLYFCFSDVLQSYYSAYLEDLPWYPKLSTVFFRKKPRLLVVINTDIRVMQVWLEISCVHRLYFVHI